ncbi:MAG: hypothetical protein PHT95_00845 [Candidatus Omnitrophica bacterium]|nr:hypothetical protein [Candidatus Omnitrophota bacterium]MDD4012932.1 hypothetical protein [Candidatus Omnitrophota bacterium]
MSEQNNVTKEQLAYGVLSYLSALCLIPILMKKDDEFIRFHARQGLMLFIIETAAMIVGIVPVLGGLVMTLGILICGLMSLAGIVQVLMGNKWNMPVISEWSEKFKI